MNPTEHEQQYQTNYIEGYNKGRDDYIKCNNIWNINNPYEEKNEALRNEIKDLKRELKFYRGRSDKLSNDKKELSEELNRLKNNPLLNVIKKIKNYIPKITITFNK